MQLVLAQLPLPPPPVARGRLEWQLCTNLNKGIDLCPKGRADTNLHELHRRAKVYKFFKCRPLAPNCPVLFHSHLIVCSSKFFLMVRAAQLNLEADCATSTRERPSATCLAQLVVARKRVASVEFVLAT